MLPFYPLESLVHVNFRLLRYSELLDKTTCTQKYSLQSYQFQNDICYVLGVATGKKKNSILPLITVQNYTKMMTKPTCTPDATYLLIIILHIQ